MNDLKDRAKSRKFISFAFIMVVSTVSMFMSLADFEQWKEVIIWSTGFYFSANSISHIMNEIKSGGKKNPPTE